MSKDFMPASRITGYSKNWVPEDRDLRKKLRELARSYSQRSGGSHFNVVVQSGSDPFQLYSRITADEVDQQIELLEPYVAFLKGVRQGLSEESAERRRYDARELVTHIAGQYDFDEVDELVEVVDHALKATGIHERLEAARDPRDIE